MESFTANSDRQVNPRGRRPLDGFGTAHLEVLAQLMQVGRAVGEQAAATAVIAKMVRVMLLAPFLLALSLYLSGARANDHADPGERGRIGRRIAIPWFAIGFIAVAGVNSLIVLPPRLIALSTSFDTIILAMAMAALDLTTRVAAIRGAGIRPLALGAILFAWLIAGGIAINAGVSALLS